MKISSFVKQVVKAIDAQPAAQRNARITQPRIAAADGFEAPKKAPVSLGKVQAASAGADAEFVKGLYRDLLGRAPDVDGFYAHMRGLENGMSRESIKQVFLSSAEYRALQQPEVPAGSTAIPGTQSTTPPGTIREPGEPLSTVPLRAEYAAAPIDTSSGPAAARSAAQWVKDTYPQLFGRGDDRQVAFEVMTHVLGAMRAHGFDAHRVVNHPSIPVGQGQRYGSDALVVGGQIFDVYGAFGEPGRSDVQLLNPGPYEAGRLRE